MDYIYSTDSDSYEYERVTTKPRTAYDLSTEADLKTIHKRNKIAKVFQTIIGWFQR